ncbi:hypothetical protein HNR42_001222 [Deinobacterium chartae]|uniref:Nitroreductase family protein n=1 Tax=Deinobacterium chartae TaxID=521158 RepID=A0A841I032_9DEIO|nr:hypothetical protein [Deinobacterium chartae]MBB6097799.1 hypothetical protein [Deinobacterium chartae]
MDLSLFKSGFDAAILREASARDLEEVLAALVRAPSLGNAQPWRVRTWRSELELSLNLEATGIQLDPGDRASLLALGDAAENAVLAAHARGYRVHLELRAQPPLALRLRLGAPSARSGLGAQAPVRDGDPHAPRGGRNSAAATRSLAGRTQKNPHRLMADAGSTNGAWVQSSTSRRNQTSQNSRPNTAA